jgi:phosphatidylglycerol lysyltransferase
MMGYFSEAYMQECQLFVAKDPDGTIQAFLNQIPSPAANEASYDLLRQAADAPGNINDYLMLSFINHLHLSGIAKLNIGLCPLAGLDNSGGIASSLLNFLYSKAGRIYSFQGLTKFKAKYEPVWQPRYIIYRSGVAGFTRTTRALLRAMTR